MDSMSAGLSGVRIRVRISFRPSSDPVHTPDVDYTADAVEASKSTTPLY